MHLHDIIEWKPLSNKSLSQLEAQLGGTTITTYIRK